MIRPYLAVIKDSYRAAASSWVLYAMIGLVTLILILIFPFGIEEQLASQIYERDIADGVALSKRLVAAGSRDVETPVKRVWERLPEDTQEGLRELYEDSSAVAPGADRPEQSMERLQKQARYFQKMLNDLNEMLDDPTLYEEQAWKDYALDAEARELLETGPEQLSEGSLARLNRLLMNAAFARELNPGPPTSIRLKYLVWNLSEAAIPIRRQELPSVLNIPFLLDKFVLSIGVFVAILVTASVVPQMLEPGSLNLLLSKPIHRWCLFLAKYIGACAFIVVLSTYFFFGLWLFFGLRLGIWDSAFLACIPLYVLVFAIYFSVSALAGAIFRSTIIAVVASILFWMLCFVVGFGYSIFSSINDSYEIDRLVVLDEDLMQIDAKNVPYLWDDSESKWKRTFVPETNEEIANMVHFVGGEEFVLPQMFGPVYDSENKQLITAQTSMMYAGSPLASGHLMGVGTKEDDWQYQESFPAPDLSVEIFRELDGSIIVATRLGSIWRLRGDPIELMKEFEQQSVEVSAVPVNIDSGVSGTPQGGTDFTPFEEVGPDIPFDFSLPASIKQNPVSGELVVYSQGTLEVITKNSNGRYERVGKNSVTLPGPKELSAKVAFAGNWIIVGRGNGVVYRIQRDTMEVLNSFEPESNAAIVDVSISPDGRWFGAVYGNGNFWLGDNQASSPEVVLAEVKGQGGISTATFADAESLWIADRINRVRRYSIDGLALEETRTPAEGVLGILYRYVLVPVYIVCPKPGEFYRLVSYLTAEEATDESVERRDSETRNPWEPLWNGLIFIAVMLLIGCLCIERQDF